MLVQRFLRNAQKQEAELDHVEQSRAWATALVRAECRGAGDKGPAMRRVARRIGVAFSRLWALDYRPPKDVPASMYQRLARAYLAMREDQIRRLEHDIEITRQIAGDGARAVCAAEALVAEANLSASQNDMASLDRG